MNWNYTEIKPTGRLGQFVDCFWYENFSEEAAKEHHVVPDNSIELIITDATMIREIPATGKSIQLKSQLTGFKTKFQKVQTSKSPHIGMRFKPQGLFPFIQSEVKDSIDSALPLSDVFAKDIQELEERILEADDVELSIGLLSDYFNKKLSQMEYANDFFLESILIDMHTCKGSISIPFLTDKYEIHAKTLERMFSERVGLPPKRYARVIRAIHAMKQTATTSNQLTEIAMDCGYFDQSHFIKEIKSLSGASPSSFRNMDYGIQTPTFLS